MIKLKELLKGPSGKKILAVGLALMLGTSLLIINGKKKTVTLAYDGKTEVVTTYKNTVESLIEVENISLDKKDKLSHPLNSTIKDDMKISIKRAVPVKVNDGGNVKEIKTATNTVSEMLKEENITLSAVDKIDKDLNNPVTKDMQVNITRVTEKLETVNQVIPFTTAKEVDKSLAPGKTDVVTEGVNGRKELTVKVVYENGKEVSRQTVSEKVACKPTNKLVAVGPEKPKETVLTASRGGRAFAYSRVLTMTATEYSQAPYDPLGGGTITASGMKVKRNPSGYSTVAVDTSVIPLGTKLYVEGYGYAIAADTGSAIKGNKIDLYFDPSQFGSWGKKSVKVYILK